MKNVKKSTLCDVFHSQVDYNNSDQNSQHDTVIDFDKIYKKSFVKHPTLESPNNSLGSSESDFIININPNNETIHIGNIEEEVNLVDYTNSNFYIGKNDGDNELYDIFDPSFQNSYILNDSPINSCNNSCSNSDYDLENVALSDSDTSVNIYYSSDDSNRKSKNKMRNRSSKGGNNVESYKKLSYKDVEKSIDKYYNIDPDSKYSSEVDILTTYIIGQKNLYIQSKYITQYKLNLLTFPSIFITAATAILAPFIDYQWWNGIIISTLNATILFLITLAKYLNYESEIEIYLQYVKQYDKLQISLEMANNKLLFIEKNKDKSLLVLSKIREIEKRINEIKESNNTIIPEEIKKLFPVICNINIFSFIKKIELNKKKLINNLRDVKNEIKYILYKWDNEHFMPEYIEQPTRRMSEMKNIEHLKERNRLQFLYEIKDKLKNEILELIHAYTYIDTIFSKEISIADKKKKWSYFCLSFFFNKKSDNFYCKTDNPIIDKYFNFILSDS